MIPVYSRPISRLNVEIEVSLKNNSIVTLTTLQLLLDFSVGQRCATKYHHYLVFADRCGCKEAKIMNMRFSLCYIRTQPRPSGDIVHVLSIPGIRIFWSEPAKSLSYSGQVFYAIELTFSS